MKNIRTKKKEQRAKISNFRLSLLLVPISLLLTLGCSKVEYRSIDEPAFIRVFNNLTYIQTLENLDEPAPFLTMLIDPVLDEAGVPISAAIVGDHLDQRKEYAAPFEPIVDNTFRNYEFPGKDDVLRGPILNGFDLSGWAQVPSGEHRVMFFARPISDKPFFDLEPRQRTLVVVDETIRLEAHEVYTWHVLQKDFNTKENGVYVRKENFHQLPLSDSLVYVNFYNLSADGFLEAPESLKPNVRNISGDLRIGMSDNMNIFLSLHKPVPGSNTAWETNIMSGYYRQFIGSVRRNIVSTHVNPYYSFPLFADPTSNGITTDIFQFFHLLVPGLNPFDIAETSSSENYNGDYIRISCYSPNGVPQRPIKAGSSSFTMLHNLILHTHSGIHNPRSFATVNSIEIVNGKAYLTTNQRNYAPPIY